MKAVVLEKPDFLSVKDLPVPLKTENKKLLKVKTCSLCRTDAKMWKYGQRDLLYPRILGHEVCAIDELTSLKYIIWPGYSCNKCKHCQTGQENLCNEMKIMGFNYDGGLCEYVLADEKALIPKPENLSDIIACLAEPLGCAINAVEQAQIARNDNVLIYGAGPAGLLVAIAVMSLDANPFIDEIDKSKLMLSESFRELAGIKVLNNPDSYDYDVVINATSAVETLTNGIKALKKAGRFCFFSGLTNSDIPLEIKNFNEVHYKQLKLIGAYGCTKKHMIKALEILKQYQDIIDLLISEIISINDVEAGLNKILSNETLKIVVKF